MTKHRSQGAAFKRQVAEELIAGETLHAVGVGSYLHAGVRLASPEPRWRNT